MQNEIAFFSYSRNDSAFALKLAKDLRKAGIKLWIDQLDIKPGSHWDASIENGLNASKCMIVILSPDSIASNNVMDEVSYALENSKRVIPILLKQCNTPFRLRRLQRVDFTGDYNEGVNQLIEALVYPVDNVSPDIQPANVEQPQTKAISVTEESKIKEKEKNEIIKAIESIKQPEVISKPDAVSPIKEIKQDVKPLATHMPMAETISSANAVTQKTLRTNFHVQRLILLIIAVITFITAFLPWVDFGYEEAPVVIFKVGGIAFIFMFLQLILIIIPLIGKKSEPLKGTLLKIILVIYILLLCWAIFSAVSIIVTGSAHNYKPGIGVWLSLIVTIAGVMVSSGLIKFDRNKPNL